MQRSHLCMRISRMLSKILSRREVCMFICRMAQGMVSWLLLQSCLVTSLYETRHTLQSLWVFSLSDGKLHDKHQTDSREIPWPASRPALSIYSGSCRQFQCHWHLRPVYIIPWAGEGILHSVMIFRIDCSIIFYSEWWQTSVEERRSPELEDRTWVIPPVSLLYLHGYVM